MGNRPTSYCSGDSIEHKCSVQSIPVPPVECSPRKNGASASTTASGSPYSNRSTSPRGRSEELLSALRTGNAGMQVLRKVIGTSSLNKTMTQDLKFVLETLEGLINRAKDPQQFHYVTVSSDGQEYLNRYLKDGLRMKRPRFVAVAYVARMCIRWQKLVGVRLDLRTQLDVPMLNQWFCVILDKWSAFEIFQSDCVTNGQPLQSLSFAVMKRQGLITSLHLRLDKLRNFLGELEDTHFDNPYHSKYHAADVVHAVHSLMRAGLDDPLDDYHRLATIFAAACHDAGHPGVTNDFRIAEGDEDAIRYNDCSVNENMSLAITYRALNKLPNNFMIDFADDKKASMRKLVISVVLATDMAHHFTKLKRLESIIESKGTDFGFWEDTTPLVEMILKAADLSNVVRPHHLALQWCDRVLDEFFAQGDRERDAGRPLSPLCDRLTVSKPGSQVGFMNFIVAPVYRCISMLCKLEEPMGNLRQQLEYWNNELKKENNKFGESSKINYNHLQPSKKDELMFSNVAREVS